MSRPVFRFTSESGGSATRINAAKSPITPANRLDHQIWWAACFPEQAGKNPATLGQEARRLGFSGSLVEREEVVPRPRRRYTSYQSKPR